MISKNQIKFIQSLHSKKNRDQEQLFIIEGVKLVSEFLLTSHFDIHSVYGTLDFIDNNKHIIEKSNVVINEITEEELKKISLQNSPNQILAVVKVKMPLLNSELLNSSINLFLDDIRDPGNLGTIIRIADWFGIKQIICSPTSTELYNPKALQASMGAVLRVNVVYIEFDELKKELKDVPIYGAVLNGQNIYKSALQNGLIVIGNEANGISENILKQISHPITIPAATNNGSESLNAANACGMICSEFFRQLNFK
jgi:TrmH family RNA methyltransferase